MYDKAARDRLENMLGYERFVLRECSAAISKFYGTINLQTVTIDQSGFVHMEFIDDEHYGSHHGATVVYNLSALLFSTCYKTLDMVFEWIIAENGMRPKHGFVEKINQLSNNLLSFTLPPLLANEPQVVNVLLSLYQNLRNERNDVTHKGWGRLLNGDLHFSRGTKITFEEVLGFSDAMAMLVDELVTATSAPDKIDWIKANLDKLQVHHKGHQFKITIRSPINVVYKASSAPDSSTVIDLEKIRESAQSVYFILTVEIDTNEEIKRWLFEWNDLSGMSSIILDNTWNAYRI